jgi:hypothetical protein
MAVAQDDGTLSADERKALLKGAVANLTREARARVQSEGEFDAILVRGSTVDHRLHFVVLMVLPTLAFGGAQVLGAGSSSLVMAMAVSAVYALLWLVLALTGGLEFERIAIDELGRLSSVRSGRDRETKGDFVRVAIPVVVIAVSGWIALGLTHDIVFPPEPYCDAPAKDQPAACMIIPNVNALASQTLPLKPLPTPSAGPNLPTASSAASPSVEPSGMPAASLGDTSGPTLGAVSVEGTKMIERGVRTFQLVVALAFLLTSIWFLRRMLTGRWVASIRPVHHRLSDG